MVATLPPPNCATGTLAPYVPDSTRPWNAMRAQHLFRRVSFGASQSIIEQALAQNPLAVVDALVDAALAAPNLPQPSWYNWTFAQYTDFNAQSTEQALEYANTWIGAMFNYGPKEKLTLFWHNHFVTRFENYFCPSWLHSYMQLLQTEAWGNFRTLTEEMGKNPAMLVYLNGVQSTVQQPNENYARELFELFTLGRDNGYTQNDIVNAARALTGWNGFTQACAPITYLAFAHDNGQKTIFGQTGNWGYDDLHQILFTQRAQLIATHICTKLYRYYVHPEPAEDIVAGMAQTLLGNNWEIEPVLRQLFRSEHFFDENVIGVQIKSPIALMLDFSLGANFTAGVDQQNFVLFAGYQLGQGLLNPVDVAGWPGDRDWINSATLTGRWQTIDAILLLSYQNTPQALVNLARNLSQTSNDPAVVAQAIVDFFIPKGLPSPETYAQATAVFKWEVPQNYYDSGEWNLFWETVPAQTALLLRHISRLPEFQLS